MRRFSFIGLLVTIGISQGAFGLNDSDRTQGIKPATAEVSGTMDAKTSTPPPVKLTKGQSFLICELTDGTTNVSDAVDALNVRLIKGLNSLTTTVSGQVMEIDTPYSISAPALTSYDRVGTPDSACVTVTKQ